jgi:soluble lytic murein transglycosylase-like protein
MFELPPNLPPPIAATSVQVNMCINFASKRYQVNPLVIKAITVVEGGKIGMFSKNTNGTYDIGIMQINSIHLPEISKNFPKIGAYELAYNPCVNIAIGSWILKKRLSETNDFWTGVGNYHSKTPSKRKTYLKKIYPVYKDLTYSYRDYANKDR